MKKYLILLLVISLVGGLFARQQIQKKKIISVATGTVSRQDLNVTVTTTGTVKAVEEVKMAGKVGGKLTYLPFKEGDRVRKGQVVARLDARELYAQLQSARSALSDAYNRLRDAENRLKNVKNQYEDAKKNFETQGTLFKQGAVSESIVDNARLQMENVKTQVESAESQVVSAASGISSARANVNLVQSQLSSMVIHAPISGTVTQKFASVGEVVTPAMPILTLTGDSALYVECNIDESDIGKIKVGSEAEITLDAYPEKTFNGKVTYIAEKSLDIQESGITFVVRISLLGQENLFRIGMSADVSIMVHRLANALLLPVEALLEKDEEKWVFVFVHKLPKVTKRKITTGETTDDYIQVLSGIHEGDIVATSNLEKLMDGMVVKIEQF